jgi:hypothetical protein
MWAPSECAFRGLLKRIRLFTPETASLTVDSRRIYAGCSGPGGPCDFASVGLVDYSTNTTYHALQTTLSRRFNRGLTFITSYRFRRRSITFRL